MFDQETINTFSGGFKVSVPGVVTFFGSPTFSLLQEVISFPISLSLEALVKKGQYVQLKGPKNIRLNFEPSKLSNEWYDPIKLTSNIAIQRGWKYPPEVLLNEGLSFNSSLGYYSAFIDLFVYSFSLVNRVNLSNAEVTQLSGEIQDRIKNKDGLYETVTRAEGKEGNILFQDLKNGTYRNEMINFEPYSLYILKENSLDTNENFKNFIHNMERFRNQKMIKSSPSSLKFPYVGMFNHFEFEKEIVKEIESSIRENDPTLFLSSLSRYSQSLGYNLGTLSEFQKVMSTLLERYRLQRYVYNIGEYSGSFLLFLDAKEFGTLKDNVIREYYNLTNKTVTISEVSIVNGHTIERISP